MSLGDLAQLEWRNPWWLLLALQPFVIATWVGVRRVRVLQYADAPLRPWAIRGTFIGTRRPWRRVAAAAMWIALACAAAGPRLPVTTAGNDAPRVTYRALDIMVVLDVSPSMAATDISPQRLQRAKLEIQDLLQRLRGERLGLVAFSGNAGLLTPPTDDYAAFAHYLALADFSIFKTPGSNIGAALDLARRYLPPQSSTARAVVLITDGESDALSGTAGTAAIEAAQQLQRAGIALYILAAGTADGAPIPVANGLPITSRTDIKALQMLAAYAGGTVESVRDGDGDWRALYDRSLLNLPGEQRVPALAQQWLELYGVFVCIAFLLSLGIARAPLRNTQVTVLIIASLCALALGGYSEQAHAAEASATQAHQAYLNGDYARAQHLYSERQGYDARMGEGATAYRRGLFPAAIKQFTAALLLADTPPQRADALFNLGNGFYRAADFRAAADAYAGVLILRPNDAKAQANLDFAAARLSQATVNPNQAGILGRRGRQTGGKLGEEIGDRPVMLESADEANSSVVANDTPQGMEHAQRTAPRTASDATQDSPRERDRLYRAALKKLELTRDRPADVIREIVKLDAVRDPALAVDLPPW